jgi:hypothetical protein
MRSIAPLIRQQLQILENCSYRHHRYAQDWVVVDYSIVNIIGDDGYWGTRPVGTPITSTAVDSDGITPFVTCTIDRYVNGDAM